MRVRVRVRVRIRIKVRVRVRVRVSVGVRDRVRVLTWVVSASFSLYSTSSRLMAVKSAAGLSLSPGQG